MTFTETIDLQDGVGLFRPGGPSSLEDAVDRVTRAITHCRTQGIERLLVDATGLEGVPIPSLVDRFLIAEEWAQVATGMVVVVLVVEPKYVHPERFGVKVAAHFGLTLDVYTDEADALRWLRTGANPVA